MKCLIAIGHSDEFPWNQLRISQEQTWISAARRELDIIYSLSKKPPKPLLLYDRFHEKLRFRAISGRFIGKIDQLIAPYLSLKDIPNYTFDSQKDFVANSYSTYFLMNRRTLALYSWFLRETDYTHLFSTTTSSFLHVERFFNHLSTFEWPENFLAGSKMNNESDLISGSGRLVSRSFMETLLNKLDVFEAHQIDDVAITLFAKRMSIPILFWNRMDIHDISDWRNIENHKTNTEGIFHFRIKTANRPELDSKIMFSANRFFNRAI